MTSTHADLEGAILTRTWTRARVDFDIQLVAQKGPPHAPTPPQRCRRRSIHVMLRRVRGVVRTTSRHQRCGCRVTRGDVTGSSELARALEVAQHTISYLRATSGEIDAVSMGPDVPDDGIYIRCDRLIDDAEWLHSLIMHTGRQLATDDPMVAASLFVQSYSYRILALAVACATTSGVVPDSSASCTAFALKSGRVSLVAYTSDEVLIIGSSDQTGANRFSTERPREELFNFILARAINDHLATLIEATRSTIRVGERLLWGNVAASLAVAFRTMEGSLGDWVQDLGTYFVEHAPSQLQGLGSFLTVEHAGRRGWFWERTNCCLYDRLPGNTRCADCSRIPPDVRRAAYRSSLEGP